MPAPAAEPEVIRKPAVEPSRPSVAAPARIEPPTSVPAPAAAIPGVLSPDTLGNRAVMGAPPIPLSAIGAPKGLADTALGTRGGAPMAPAGVTIGSRTPNTARFRDSVAGVRMRAIPELARTHAPTGRELAELRGSQQLAAVLQRRATTSGNSRDVHAMQGEGMGGDGAVGGAGGSPGLAGVSIPLPLFSSGPSAAQRKKNEQVDAAVDRHDRKLNSSC